MDRRKQCQWMGLRKWECGWRDCEWCRMWHYDAFLIYQIKSRAVWSLYCVLQQDIHFLHKLQHYLAVILQPCLHPSVWIRRCCLILSALIWVVIQTSLNIFPARKFLSFFIISFAICSFRWPCWWDCLNWYLMSMPWSQMHSRLTSSVRHTMIFNAVCYWSTGCFDWWILSLVVPDLHVAGFICRDEATC